MRRFSRAGADERRTATPGKSRLSWFLASLVAVAMLLSFTNLAHQALSHMQQRLGFTTAPPSRLEPVAQGWLGAQVANLTAAEAERSGFAQPQGAKVVASIPGGPAALAGVERGDILISIDRRPIANAADVTRLAGAKGPGSVAELRLLREGREQLIRVTLSARPPPTFQARRGRAPAAPGHALSEGVLQACALEALVLTLAALLMSLTGREFSAPDWDLEWLVTLPVPLATLLCVRILERTIVNPTGLVALWPFLSLVSWECGYRSAAPLIGLAATVPLLLIIAAFWTVIDASLRLRVRPSRLRNLQAVVSVAAVASIYFAMSAGLSANSYVLNWAPLLPKWLFLLPPGLAVDMLTSSAPAAIATSLVLLILEALVCAGLVFALLNRQLRFG